MGKATITKTTTNSTSNGFAEQQISRLENWLATTRRLRDVLMDSGEYDEEFQGPTSEAATAAAELLRRSHARSSDVFPVGVVAPDGAGGIRILWRQDDKQVRLVVPAAGAREAYLYWQEGDAYDGEKNVSAPAVTRRLRWLTRK